MGRIGELPGMTQCEAARRCKKTFTQHRLTLYLQVSWHSAGETKHKFPNVPEGNKGPFYLLQIGITDMTRVHEEDWQIDV